MGDSQDVASLFDGLLHGRNANCLKDRTKVVVLRPLVLHDLHTQKQGNVV